MSETQAKTMMAKTPNPLSDVRVVSTVSSPVARSTSKLVSSMLGWPLAPTEGLTLINRDGGSRKEGAGRTAQRMAALRSSPMQTVHPFMLRCREGAKKRGGSKSVNFLAPPRARWPAALHCALFCLFTFGLFRRPEKGRIAGRFLFGRPQSKGGETRNLVLHTRSMVVRDATSADVL